MTCPYCGAENLEGVDECGECGQPLTDSHLSDPATLVEQRLLTDRVGLLEPKAPIAVAADTPVRSALRTMVDRGSGCLIVAAAGKPVGIFTERDALSKLGTNAQALGDRPVSEFMTPEPQTLEIGAKVAFAVQRMAVGEYRHMPIVGASGELTGIISVRDILLYLTNTLPASGQSGTSPNPRTSARERPGRP